MATPFAHDIPIKKRFGQHFLRLQHIADAMVQRVSLNEDSSVLEIGCGDGFLTRAILQYPLARLWVFEIDPDWVKYVKQTITDPRMVVFEENILDVDFFSFEPYKPWTLLSNLPYQITFPILHMLQRERHLLAEGVIMIQEEVAQKLVKTHGRGYGYPSLFFNHYFHIELMQKIPPTAFYPPPKVDSRLVYLKPKQEVVAIPDEEKFWKFIKACFAQPRRILRNNLAQTHYDINKVPEEMLTLRAQQLSMDDLLALWNLLKA